MNRFSDCHVLPNGHFEGKMTVPGTSGPFSYEFGARVDIFLIREAWERGCDFEKEADGYGPGLGTLGGDWSGIRDSTDGAVAIMFTKALNFLFGHQVPKAYIEKR